VNLIVDARAATATPCEIVSSFAAEQYDALLRIVEDSALLPPTWDAWRRGFDDRLTSLRRRGTEAVVVPVELEAFVRWCADQGVRCDAESRLEYAENAAAPAP
jgi:hypothetical protein